MKTKVITLLLFISASLNLQAQDFKGIATYEAKMTLPESATENEKMAQLDDEMQKAIKEAMESALHKTYTLTFDKNASLFAVEKKLAPANPMLSISLEIDGDGVLYKNIRENKLLIETDLFEKEFLITDSLRKYEWKLESETKKIGNYTCYKATTVIKGEKQDKEAAEGLILLGEEAKDTKVTVWYCPEIPVSHGPSNFWGLPGLILETNDGVTTYLCSKIVLNPKNKVEIKTPKKGQKISAAEFEELSLKKAKEFEDANGGGEGQMIIIGG
jgi:GLPGLI family protein